MGDKENKTKQKKTKQTRKPAAKSAVKAVSKAAGKTDTRKSKSAPKKQIRKAKQEKKQLAQQNTKKFIERHLHIYPFYDVANINPKDFAHIEAIILSMTPEERKNPSILKASRKERIAKGSGTSVMEVNQLLNQFEEMKKMMKMLNNKNFKFPM